MVLTFFLPAFHKWNKYSRRLQTILFPEFKLLFGFTVLSRSSSFLLGIIVTYTLLSERIIRTLFREKLRFEVDAILGTTKRISCYKKLFKD